MSVDKTYPELIEEMSLLKQRIKELEHSGPLSSGTNEVLSDSEAKYRTIVENSLVAVYIVQDRLFRFVNKRWCEIFGYRYEEVVDKMGPQDLVHPKDLKIMEENVQRRFSGETDSTEYEIRIVRRDGRIVTLRVFGSIMPYKGRTAILGTAIDITNLRKTQEQLRANQTRLSEAINLAHIVNLEIDPEEKMFILNDPFYAFHGTTAEQEGGYRMSPEELAQRFIHPDDREHFFNTMKENATRGNPEYISNMELRVIRRPKEVRYTHCRTRPIRDKSGRIVKIYGAIQDITERKKAESKLQESEQRFREMANMLPQTVCELDLDGTFTFANRNGLMTFGITEEEMNKGLNVTQFIIPENRERAIANLRKILNGENTEDREYTAITKDGRTFPALVYSTPIIRNDKAVGIRCILVDITDRKLNERTLAESEEKYRNVIENSLVGFFIVKNGLFRYVNKQFCEILGYTYEEIVNKAGPLDFVHPDDRDLMAENIRKRMSGETDRVEYEFRARRKDGQLINLKIIGTTMMYEGERAATGTILDVTKEKNLETQLRQAQKMEAIGTLAGGIAHDFNNILTALMGYASLIRTNLNPSDPVQSYVSQVLAASEKAADLTRSLLTFSRQQPLILAPLNINNNIKNTEKLLRRLLTEDIELRISLCKDDPIIMADKSQIDQILFNLVTNARDSMPHGGTLTIETNLVNLDDTFRHFHGYGEKGTYALLSGSDTGTGMDEATRERIFDPFFTTKEVGKGTGLGLATVYGIVKQHNGYKTFAR